MQVSHNKKRLSLKALDGNRVTEEPCSPESAENTPDPLVGQVHTGASHSVNLHF